MIVHILIVFAAVAIGLFLFKCDADLPLVYLPFQLEGSFAGKVVWITGASSGIGAALAEDMVKAGAKVIISARRQDKLEAVARRCSELSDEPVMILPLDVTDFEAQRAAYDAVIARYGYVDSLVLNAGKSQRNVAVTTPLEATQQLIELNYLSYVSLTTMVLPKMIERRTGQLVVMSSLSGIMGTPGASSYSGSKFALHGYFNALRSEVSQHNIGVTIICPGPVESEIAQHTIRDPNNPVGEEGAKMPTERCTYLTAKAMHYGMMEAWISDQPFLLLTYLMQYVPTPTKMLFNKVLGPKRVQALQQGINVYDVNALFAGK